MGKFYKFKQQAKEAMAKAVLLFALFFYVMGVLGGLGCALHANAYVIAIGVVIVAAMALPTAIEIFEELTK